MTCECAGSQHLVCRDWRVSTARDPIPRGPSLPRAPRAQYQLTIDPARWVIREIQKQGPVPETFRYRPPASERVSLDDALDCQCKGKRHPVCMPARRWREWVKAVHRMLDREALRPEPEAVESAA